MTTLQPTTISPASDAGVFGPHQTTELAHFFRAHGFAILRGFVPAAQLAQVEDACTLAQEALLRGELSEAHGTTSLVDETNKEVPVANYVTRITDLSPLVRNLVMEPIVVGLMNGWLDHPWLLEGEPFGVVLQDARPGRESAYTRIGWHSDWQGTPHLTERWPSVAFTLHLDATSPANGFLRVVPGSHLWATPAAKVTASGEPVRHLLEATGGYTDAAPPFDMPRGFDKIPGEIAVYCEYGDLLFHDGYLWHSAARATDDDTRRRHVRGSWYSGKPTVSSVEDFVKNAAR